MRPCWQGNLVRLSGCDIGQEDKVKITKRLVIILTLLGVLALSACGRLSTPIPPDDSFYPHTYAVEI